MKWETCHFVLSAEPILTKSWKVAHLVDLKQTRENIFRYQKITQRDCRHFQLPDNGLVLNWLGSNVLIEILDRMHWLRFFAMASKQIQKIEEVFPIIGDIGRSQIALLVVLWISTIPPTIQEFINIFLTLDPEWEYRVFNITSNTSTWMKGSDKIDRCKFSRADWRFLGVSDKHSIVTEVCIWMWKR